MDPSNKRILLRLIGLAVGIPLIGVCALGIYIGYYFVRIYDDGLEHEPIRLSVDLSQTGQYQGPYRQKYIPTHGVQIRFETDPPFESSEQMEQALAPFKAEITVTKSTREVVLSEELTIQSFRDDDSPGCRWFAPMAEFTPYVFIWRFEALNDEATLTLDVRQPAPGMKGRTQQLVSKNVLCRTESLNIYKGWVFIIGGTLGIVLGIYICVGSCFIGKIVKYLFSQKDITPESGVS